METFFGIEKAGTTVAREILAGCVTFFTMAYIIVVNPAILEHAGIPKGPSMVATVVSAALGTLLMGVYARRPFAIAPYMGENAFIAYTVVQVLGYSWQTALAAVFLGGVLFVLLTLTGWRARVAQDIPLSLKVSFAAGIGFFLALIGLHDCGFVVGSSQGAPLSIGDLSHTQTRLAVLGFLVMAGLMVLRVRAALLLGMMLITGLAFLTGQAPLPEQWFSLPPSLAPVFAQIDFAGAFQWGFLSVILTVFVMDFVDTMGSLIGLGARAGLLDEDGNLPDIEKPMFCDAIATVVASVLGTTTTGTYIESAAGIEAGGRTGLTAVVTGILFLLALWFSPVLCAVPKPAYGPVLVVVGMLMMPSIRNLAWDDLTELIPAFCVVMLMSFTFNIGIGMTAGFLVYPLFKLIAGRIKEMPLTMWVLFALSLLYYLVSP